MDTLAMLKELPTFYLYLVLRSLIKTEDYTEDNIPFRSTEEFTPYNCVIMPSGDMVSDILTVKGERINLQSVVDIVARGDNDAKGRVAPEYFLWKARNLLINIHNTVYYVDKDSLDVSNTPIDNSVEVWLLKCFNSSEPIDMGPNDKSFGRFELLIFIEYEVGGI